MGKERLDNASRNNKEGMGNNSRLKEKEMTRKIQRNKSARNHREIESGRTKKRAMVSNYE